ncbi:MAG: hypothetical protein U0441_37920 [Polyangiaceae bacterium]
MGTTALLALQLDACCKIFDRGNDDQGVQAQGPDPVTGDLPAPRNGFLADLGFRPRTNGYNFENGGNANYPRTAGFVGPAEMVKLFGAKDVCIGGKMMGNTCRMTPAASEFARKVNKSMNGGQCEGMAVSSLTFFKNIDQISTVVPGARSAHDASREQVRGTLGYYFAYQFSDPVISAKMDAKRRFTPVQTMERVVDLINKGDPGVLFIRSPDNMSGHAVSPYAVEDRGNGIYWIRIYDNNWPNKERYVEIDKNLNTWKYELAAINPAVAKMPWGGDATTYNFGVVPISVRTKQKMVCPFCKSTRTRGVMGDSTSIANVTITDDENHVIGMKDGKFVNEIPNARRIDLDGWIDGQPVSETMYELPEGKGYDVDVEGKEGAKDDGDVVIWGAGTAVTIENVKPAAKQKDRISVSPDGTGIRYKPAAKGKIPPMKVAMDDEKNGFVFHLSNVDNDDDDDDVEVKLDRGAGKLQIFGASNKAGKGYDLKMVRQKEDDKDDDVVEQKAVKFAKPNEAHTLTFGGWAGKGKPIKMEKVVVKAKPHFGPMRPLGAPADAKKDDPKKDDPKAATKDDKDPKKPVITLPTKPKDDGKKPPPKITIKPKK